MKPLTMEEIRKVVRGWRLSSGGDLMVGNVSIDSRTARDGDLFVAIPGEHFDGHNFLREAGEKGCVAAVIRRDVKVPDEVSCLFYGGIIGVLDTHQALMELGAANRKAGSADVVAVTGSNGKTTVKRMIHHVLGKKLKGSCSPMSYNNRIGVPLTLLDAGLSDDYVVVELGTSAPGEISRLAAACEPNVAVITSCSATHLEGLGSVDRVASEKASLLGRLRQRGMAVVTADSDVLRRSLGAYRERVILFGEAEEADIRLTGYEPSGRGVRFEVNNRLWADLPVAGRHNALNALAAIAVAQRFGFSQDEAAEALADFTGEAMRLEWTDAGEVTVINDAYNANPASMVAAADVLVDNDARRRVLIAGDMCELGDQAEQLHLETGLDVARRGLDLVIGVGELGVKLAEGAAKEDQQTRTYLTVEQVMDDVCDWLRPGDLVLVKGSRSMRMERVVRAIASEMGAEDTQRGDQRGEEGTHA